MYHEMYHDQLPQIRNTRVFIEKKGMLQRQNGYLFLSFNVTVSTLPESGFFKVFRKLRWKCYMVVLHK